MEKGVRQHCKFEQRPVQEMVYQLTDTEHLVYSPQMQTSTIVCKNASSEIVHLDIATKIHIPEKFMQNSLNTLSHPLLLAELLPHLYNLPGPGIHSPYLQHP
jgi:hypothetical protein